MSKPLFIPLKTIYYDAFKNGSKHEEFRIYGPRWNERTCAVDRQVVISKGYGKKNRMKGVVCSFKIRHASELSVDVRSWIKDIYGELDVDMACIGIADLKPQPDISE